jgi:A/G-specific adenine glycosylase
MEPGGAASIKRGLRLSVTDSSLATGTLAQLRTKLLAWYDRHRRALPWRERPSLYGTWIAEIMLQQTTVAAVVPYWERFLARFPDVVALAAAPLTEVLALWAGLGYYRRARSLHDAARLVAARGRGRLPDDYDGWRSLPGVGDYTAGAIASIGLGQRVPAVDANARRVITRWHCGSSGAAAACVSRLPHWAAALVDPERPGDWNQAVMELGAIICRAARPACSECPVRRFCRAGRSGRAESIPRPVVRERRQPVWLSLLVIAHRDGLLMVPPAVTSTLVRIAGAGRPVRSDVRGLTQGYWGLPCTPWYRWPPPVRNGTTVAADRALRLAGAAWRAWLAAVGYSSELPAGGRVVRHGITRYSLTALVCRVQSNGNGSVPPGLVPIRGDELSERPIAALARKALVAVAATGD